MRTQVSWKQKIRAVSFFWSLMLETYMQLLLCRTGTMDLEGEQCGREELVRWETMGGPAHGRGEQWGRASLREE